MKKLIIFTSLILALVSNAQTIITATLTVTNASGTSNGMTISVNGIVRTWTNVVTSPTVQILTNSTIGGSATNLFNAFAVAISPNTFISMPATNQVQFQSFPGSAMVIIVTNATTTNWATVTYSTNTVTQAIAVRAPFGVGGTTENTAVENALAQYLSDVLGTNTIPSAAPIFVFFVGTSNAQTISGVKIFSGGIGGIVAHLTNGTWLNPSFTNGQNFGLPFRSPGGGSGSEQFGLSSSAATNGASAFGHLAIASTNFATAVGFTSLASGSSATAIGSLTVASGFQDTALGADSAASGGLSVAIGAAGATATNSTAIGANAESDFADSTSLGSGAAATATNQFTAQSASGSWWNPGTLQVDGGISNLNSVAGGTNTFRGIVATPTYANSSLASGPNAAVSFGTNSYVVVSGPILAFSINGVLANVDGAQVTIENSTGQTMTIANQSGIEPTAANRIITGPAADYVTTNNPGVVTLRYKGASSRWILVSHN